MHGSYSRKNGCSCVKRPESQHRTHTFLNKPMILFDNVIEIFNLSYLDAFRNLFLLFQLLNGDWIGWVLINCYDTRLRNMKRPQSFLEKALCSLLVYLFCLGKNRLCFLRNPLHDTGTSIALLLLCTFHPLSTSHWFV